MTAFLQCFLNFIPNRVCFNSEPRELVWKSVRSILHRNFVSKFHIFSKKNPTYILIFRFFRFQTQENRFWGLGTFLHVFLVQQFTDLFTVWKMFHKLSPILCISFSYVCSRQYGISPLKTNNFKIIEICVKGVTGKSRFFN